MRPKISPGRTADGVKLEQGMRVWVNSTVIGEPPVQRTVSSVESEGRKFLYPEEDENGHIGCKCSSSWKCPRRAMLYALMEGTFFGE